MEELWRRLGKLESLDLSESVLGSKESPYVIEGIFNKLDLTEAKGYVVIKSQFTNILDASNAELDHLALEGHFNVIDLSHSKIGRLDRSRANINFIDTSGSQIKEIKV